MRSPTRRADWQVVDVDDLPVPPGPLHETPIGPAVRRLVDAAHEAYRLAVDHADLAADTDPATATDDDVTRLRVARRRAETAVEKARLAQSALGADVLGRRGRRWQSEIDTGRAAAARNVAEAVRQVLDVASGFDAVDRAQAWRDSATLAADTGARWPVGYEAPPRFVVIGSRRYPLDVVLTAVAVAYSNETRNYSNPVTSTGGSSL